MILSLAWLRFPLRSFARPALAVLGVALGVAVTVSVDLANEASLRSFRRSAEALAGRATHRVVGGPGGIPEGTWRRLRVDGAIRPVSPVVEGVVELPGPAGGTLALLGTDPFSEGPFRPFLLPGERGGGEGGAPRGELLRRLLVVPGAVAGTEEALARLAGRPPASPEGERPPSLEGRSFPVRAGGRERRLVVAAVLDPPDEATREGLSSVLVADVATAQELLGKEGRLDRIDVAAPPGKEGEALLSRLSSLLPGGAALLPAGDRAGELERLTRAFRANLSAFGLLALLVGALLVHNSLSFAVLSRREHIGLLRALGVTRREVVSLVAAEALAVGAAGTFAGLLAGNFLARTILLHVAGTMNDLYASVDAREVPLLPLSVLKGALLGVGVTLASALLPALEASSATPREVLSRSRGEERFRRRLPRFAAAGALLLAAGWLVLSRPGGAAAGYGGMVASVVGYSLLVPGALLLLCRLLAPPLRLLPSPLASLAVRSAGASLSRTGVAAAALVTALSAAVGVGVMVGSFRGALVGWLDRTLHAHVFVTSEGMARGAGRLPLPPALVARLSSLPGVAFASTVRRLPADAVGAPAELFVSLVPPGDVPVFDLKEGRGERSFRAFREEGALFVSEPLALRAGLARGSSVTLRTERGPRTFPVEAVYRDYGSDRGAVAMARETFDRHWSDRSVDALGLYLADPSLAAGTEASARRLAAEAGGAVEVRSNRGLRDASLAVFDRTFAVTGVLRLLVVLVAFTGVAGALLALAVERAGERALLRALGATGGQLFALVLGEALVLGLFAGLLSLPLGLLQGEALVKAILLRSFGWTIPVSVPPGTVLSALLPAAAAALLSGVWPALRSARELPAPALREE